MLAEINQHSGFNFIIIKSNWKSLIPFAVTQVAPVSQTIQLSWHDFNEHYSSEFHIQILIIGSNEFSLCLCTIWTFRWPCSIQLLRWYPFRFITWVLPETKMLKFEFSTSFPICRMQEDINEISMNELGLGLFHLVDDCEITIIEKKKYFEKYIFEVRPWPLNELNVSVLLL